MIDLHTHILPSLDDGPHDLEEAMAMVKQSVLSNVTAVLATPHIYEEPSDAYLKKIQMQYALLKTAIAKEKIVMDLYLGAEIYIHPNLLAMVKKYPQLTMNQSGRHVLIEFPSRELPLYSETVIYQTAVQGCVPVMAHPERCQDIQKNPRLLIGYIQKGALMQMDAGSLLGHYGRRVKKTAKYCLKNNLVHIIASDLHSSHMNTHPLVEVRKAALKIIDENTFEKMVMTLPESIVK